MQTSMNPIVFFYPEGHEAHMEIGHPERPERVEVIRQALEEQGYWDTERLIHPLEVPKETLHTIHTPSYLNTLQKSCQQGVRLDADTYLTPSSWNLALQAAGGAIHVATQVWKGKARRGFALTRPPGHHATPNRGMGFCLLNNVAIAAEHLLQNQGAKRVTIVDLDLHHGNGTQEIFYRRGEVLYISTHQSPHYPGTGHLQETGTDEGAMTTVNLPLPPLSGDRAFQSCMETVILPLLSRYEPEMLLISFGFDPHWRDPLGQLLLSAGTYGKLIHQLASWADEHCAGHIALFLEGGYDLKAGAVCAKCVTAALLDKPFEDTLGPSPYQEQSQWQAILAQAVQIWDLK